MADAPSLEELFRAHYRFVWRIVRRLGVPEPLVDDAVQEVFVVLHRRQGSLLWGESPVRSLLFGIARRVAKRQRERASRSTPASWAPAVVDDPERNLEVQRKADVVRAAMDAMDEGKRMTFLLVEIEGMAVPEVAECLGINVNTAYTRLRAARKILHRAVARHRAAEEGRDGRPRSR